MSLSSYSNVFGLDHERGYEEEILSGDIVCTGANQFPRYEVIAIRGDRAWLRDLQSGADHLGYTSRCRKLQPQALALAAE